MNEHGKFIQISTMVTSDGPTVFALDENGNIYEKNVSRRDAVWVKIS